MQDRSARRPIRRPVTAIALGLLWAAAAQAGSGDCDPTPGLSRVQDGGWGLGERNTRFQADTRIDAANVQRLTLKWAYGFASRQPRSWPLVTEDTLFIGDSGRGVVALDRETGCTRWVFEHTGQIGTAILHARLNGRDALIFSSRNDGIYAVDAASGEPIWRARPAQHPVPMYSGTPLLDGDALFVPISSLEIGLAINPLYGCCTTSGAVTRLNAATGETVWYRPTIDQPPRITGRHLLVVEEHGPSGAPVWGTPTLDTRRGVVYFGSGQNYSRPATATSDAIFAVDAATGGVRWTRQFTADDAFNMACSVPGHPNCPDPPGPDVDFGAPPMLARSAAGDRLIAGQKSGDVYALQPDSGEVVWHRRLGRGGALGGIHWGMAVNEALGLALVPVSDIEAMSGDMEPHPGLHALHLADGSAAWTRQRRGRCDERICSAGLSAAITATPEVVFAGSLDGYLEAYEAATGELLWSHDSWRDYDTVNGVPAAGGAFDAHGPMVVDDLVIVSSGYESFGEKGGNVLLVFRLAGEGSPEAASP